MGGNPRDVVVNLSIATNTKHDYKLLTVIGPKRPAMQSFIRSLEHSLSSMSHFWVSRFSDSVKRDFRISFQNDSSIGGETGSSSPISMSVAETANQSYKTEEAAYYYFYKILMNRHYSIGTDVANFVSEFIENFPPKSRTVEDGTPSHDRFSIASSSTIFNPRQPELQFDVPTNLLPSESSQKILIKIEKIIAQFDSNYLSLKNPSSTLVDDLLPRLRPSIERFVFESLGKYLYAHYRVFYQDMDRIFFYKSAAIRGAHHSGNTPLLSQSCGVRECFQFQFTNSIALANELQHICDSPTFTTPNLLLQRLLSILVSIKTEVLTGTRGDKELESMDDIAPIFLFLVVSASELRTPNAIYKFLLDSMPTEQRMETEGRAVALLEGATRIVLSEWSNEWYPDDPVPDPPVEKTVPPET